MDITDAGTTVLRTADPDLPANFDRTSLIKQGLVSAKRNLRLVRRMETKP